MSFDSGRAVVYRNGVMEDGNFDQSRFLKPGSIGFKRWQGDQIWLRNSQGLIGYFPFIQIEDGIVHNFAQFDRNSGLETIPDAKIFAATWVGGRWPGKRALMFETPGDYVKLDFPGEYQELTFAVWIKLDRIVNSHNAILNSDGWHPGAVHWQINRSGGPWLSTFQSTNVDIQGSVPPGQWVHLASTISTKTKYGKTFLNGRLVSQISLTDNVILRPGKCRLGNWLKSSPHLESRALHSRIDELMIWNRRLSQEEIQAMADQGKPRR
jgi:hypothetical protein